MDSPLDLFSELVMDAISMASDTTSISKNVRQARCVAVQMIYTGTPVGSLIIQASNDNVNFSAVSTTAVSAAGSTMINFDAPAWGYIRVFYDATSGAGNLSARINAKGV